MSFLKPTSAVKYQMSRGSSSRSCWKMKKLKKLERKKWLIDKRRNSRFQWPLELFKMLFHRPWSSVKSMEILYDSWRSIRRIYFSFGDDTFSVAIVFFCIETFEGTNENDETLHRKKLRLTAYCENWWRTNEYRNGKRKQHLVLDLYIDY